MKSNFYHSVIIAAAIMTSLFSCTKDAVKTTSTITASTGTTLAATATQSIAITSLASTALGHDSLYVMNCFPPKGSKDPIAFSALPTAVGTYLTANYAGYNFLKAFKTLDSAKAVNGYVVIVNFNSKPVGLKFDATGTFVKVLEQRAGHDLKGGPGFHPGGPFQDRDGKGRDTVAISALPAAVTTFFSTTYPTDTLLHADLGPDTTYILISKNNGLFATAITKTGTLIKRIAIDKHPGPATPVAQSALLSAITTYLTATYPGYVFDKAFAEKSGTTVQAYVVFINVNDTRYAVKLDVSGTFVNAKVLR